MVRIEIREPVLKWAVNRTRIPVEHLKTKQEFGAVEKWLSGEKSPTLNQAHALARRARIPFGYLLLEEPVDDSPDVKDFRTMNSDVRVEYSPVLEELIHSCQYRLSVYKDLSLQTGQGAPDLAGEFGLRQDSKECARQTLQKLDWFPGIKEKNREGFLVLADAIEEIGILVQRSTILGNNSYLSLDLEEFRGFTLTDEGFALIFINGLDSSVGTLFSLAHELGHVVLGEPGVTGERNDQKSVERWCNQFAAELLAPIREIAAIWESSPHLEAATNVAYEKFGVSRDTVIWSLVDARLLDRSRAVNYLKALRQDTDDEKNSSSGGNFYNNLGARQSKRYVDAVTGALVDGIITTQEASRHLSIPKIKTLNEVVIRYQGTGIQGVA